MTEKSGRSTAEEVRLLRDRFGNEVELADDHGRGTVYRILHEFSLLERTYAVLQSAALRKEEEYAIFRISSDEHGEPQLETIEDDDEWEEASEIYDELLFAQNFKDEDN